MTTQSATEAYCFDVERYFPRSLYQRITEIRVDDPQLVLRQARARRQRQHRAPDGKLTILAADHPGRGVTRIGSDPYRMADRYQYLGRILRVLLASEFDGFMSTPDMIDELLIVDHILQQGGRPSFLDGRLLVGCMQRGGVAGVIGEIDDRFTAYTAEALHEQRLDGGKMMFRFVPEDERTLWTIEYCARVVTALNRLELAAFVEVLPMDRQDGKLVGRNNAEELIPLVGVIASLGDSSRNLWVKIPYCPGYERVAAATTAPILMLGGASRENPAKLYEDFAIGMAADSNVRGALVGRNVSFPGNEDPAAVARAVWAIVHRGVSAQEAEAIAASARDAQIDQLQGL